MAHYALLDENNIVTQVITGKDETDTTENWEQYYGNLKGQTCKRTSYNTENNEHLNGGTAFRGNYACIGFTYDETNNVFIPPQPYASWVLNENIWDWEAPTAKPDDDFRYYWNEDTTSWEVINE